MTDTTKKLSDDVIVSICCITYNHEQYIKECIEGLIMQKTTFKYEILIHDDASTDKTADIIRDYTKIYPDIIKPILQTENQYSKGIKIQKTYNYSRAKGKYIALCEGDDYWIDPLKLQKQFDFMESNPDYILCGTNGLILWDYGSNAPNYSHRIFTSRELMPEDIIGKWPFPTASLLFRKELLYFSDDFKCKIYSGDIRLILVALANGRIWSLSDTTTVYRLNNNINSSTNRIKSKNDHGQFYIGQMIKLYSSYNEYTNQRFSKVVDNTLIWLRKIHTVIEYRKKIGILAFFIHPYTSFKITFKLKIYSSIKKWVYRYCQI